MISKKSVIVVGAGIVGCAIARELAVRGMSVTVFDDRPVALQRVRRLNRLAGWADCVDDDLAETGRQCGCDSTVTAVGYWELDRLERWDHILHPGCEGLGPLGGCQ